MSLLTKTKLEMEDVTSDNELTQKRDYSSRKKVEEKKMSVIEFVEINLVQS